MEMERTRRASSWSKTTAARGERAHRSCTSTAVSMLLHSPLARTAVLTAIVLSSMGVTLYVLRPPTLPHTRMTTAVEVETNADAVAAADERGLAVTPLPFAARARAFFMVDPPGVGDGGSAAMPSPTHPPTPWYRRPWNPTAQDSSTASERAEHVAETHAAHVQEAVWTWRRWPRWGSTDASVLSHLPDPSPGTAADDKDGNTVPAVDTHAAAHDLPTLNDCWAWFDRSGVGEGALGADEDDGADGAHDAKAVSTGWAWTLLRGGSVQPAALQPTPADGHTGPETEGKPAGFAGTQPDKVLSPASWPWVDVRWLGRAATPDGTPDTGEATVNELTSNASETPVDEPTVIRWLPSVVATLLASVLVVLLSVQRKIKGPVEASPEEGRVPVETIDNAPTPVMDPAVVASLKERVVNLEGALRQTSQRADALEEASTQRVQALEHELDTVRRRAADADAASDLKEQLVALTKAVAEQREAAAVARAEREQAVTKANGLEAAATAQAAKAKELDEVRDAQVAAAEARADAAEAAAAAAKAVAEAAADAKDLAAERARALEEERVETDLRLTYCRKAVLRLAKAKPEERSTLIAVIGKCLGMSEEELQAAEAAAQATPPGPVAGEGPGLVHGPGSGVWSFGSLFSPTPSERSTGPTASPARLSAGRRGSWRQGSGSIVLSANARGPASPAPLSKSPLAARPVGPVAALVDENAAP